MKILTQQFYDHFDDYDGCSINNNEDPLVIVKIVDPYYCVTWYLTEFYPDTQEGYGYSEGYVQVRWAYVDLRCMDSIKNHDGSVCYWDREFTPKPLSQCVQLNNT